MTAEFGLDTSLHVQSYVPNGAYTYGGVDPLAVGTTVLGSFDDYSGYVVDWDLDGDGQYDDIHQSEVGVWTPLTANQISTFGWSQSGTHTVAARVSGGKYGDFQFFDTVTINNAPTFIDPWRAWIVGSVNLDFIDLDNDKLTFSNITYSDNIDFEHYGIEISASGNSIGINVPNDVYIDDATMNESWWDLGSTFWGTLTVGFDVSDGIASYHVTVGGEVRPNVHRASSIPTSVEITSLGGGNSAAISISENSAKVASGSAAVSGAATLIYSLSGPDAYLFNIDAYSGEVYFKAAPDFENPQDFGKDNTYNITLGVTAYKVSDFQDISVTVTNQPGNTIAGGDKNDVITPSSTVSGQPKPTSEEDHLYGNNGNDTLDGGLGADVMDGGAGYDNFYVDNVGDVVIEGVNGGTDTVYSSISYALSANVERLVLLGSAAIDATGNELGNRLTGNSGSNHLYGLAGNDTLDGKGGIDILEGGTGNDTYVIDDWFDSIVEKLGEGTDSVTASVSYSLGSNLENLTLIGSVATDGTGNELNNSLKGNGADNHLYGLGGNDTLDGQAGADTLIGGLGNDTYVIDNVGDVIIENANEGTDTVKAGFTYTLSDPNLENLTLTGSAAIDGTGNSGANSLIGNAAANRLYGLDGNDKLNGGLGADIMVGGLGNDSYTVDNIGDVVTENANEGTDSVSASVNYVLGANLEKLTLTGSANLDGTGNELANSLTGNAASNHLSGLAGKDTLSGGLGNDVLSGGLAADTLTGGGGADQFLFDVIETSANKDTIKDFEHGIDDIALSRSVFSAFASSPQGAISASAFTLGTAATTTAQHLIYDKASGALYYDADGVGGQAQVQIALLSTKPVLDAGDFVLI